MRHVEKLPPTIFSRLSEAGRDSALFTSGAWEGVGRLCGAADGESTAHVGRCRIQHFAGDEGASASNAAAGAVKLLGGETCPDVVAIYTHLVDSAGHKHGFGLEVPEYLEAIHAFDSLLDSLLSAVEARRDAHAEEEWLVAMTTDHGGTSTSAMPPELWRGFEACGCCHIGISQRQLAGVHGLTDLRQHSQTFVVLAGVPGIGKGGEMLPAPAASDLAPLLLRHLLDPPPPLPPAGVASRRKRTRSPGGTD